MKHSDNDLRVLSVFGSSFSFYYVVNQLTSYLFVDERTTFRKDQAIVVHKPNDISDSRAMIGHLEAILKEI